MMDMLTLFYLLKPLPEYVAIQPSMQILSEQIPLCEEIPYRQADELARYRLLQKEIKMQRSLHADQPQLQKLADELSQTVNRLELLAERRWNTPQYDLSVTWYIPEEVMFRSQSEIPQRPNEHPLQMVIDKVRLTDKSLQLLSIYYGDQNAVEELQYFSWRFIHLSPHLRHTLVDINFRKKMTAIEYCQILPLLQLEIKLDLKFETLKGGIRIQTQKFYLNGVVI